MGERLGQNAPGYGRIPVSSLSVILELAGNQV